MCPTYSLSTITKIFLILRRNAYTRNFSSYFRFPLNHILLKIIRDITRLILYLENAE